MKRLGRWALLVVPVLAACGDSGPEGPGTYTVSLDVTGPPAGAVLFEVTGSGIQALRGTGDTRVFTSSIDPSTGLHRVIAVSRSGMVGFQIDVSQVEVGTPLVVVVDAAGTDNQPRGPAGLGVRIAD